MALQTQVFDHDTPSAPVRAGGMLLDSAGVKLSPHHTIGTFAGASSSDGSFSDSTGQGQIDYDSAGYLYVADTLNNRVQRFAISASGIWVYESKLGSLTTLLGGGTSPNLLAIDRSRNEIHLAANDHYTASNWISVWSLADWPNLTTLNRVRQYGANANSNVADRAYAGYTLTIDSTYAVVASAFSPFRQLRWNHVTGALQNQDASSIKKGKWTTDGAGNWWTSIGFGSAGVGLYKADPSTFATGTKIDTTSSSSYWRRARMTGGAPLAPVYHDGKVYCRGYLGDWLAWSAADNSFLDLHSSPGPLGASNAAVGQSGWARSSDVLLGRAGIAVDANGCAWLVCWSQNADNTADQSFLVAWPLSTATATWTKNDWSAGTNTLKSLLIGGEHLSGEKWKARIRKNSGSWITFTSEDLLTQAFFDSVGTFTEGDTLTLEISLSTNDRLDFASGLTFCRDKISPQNVFVQLGYEDDAATNFVPQATGAFLAKLGGSGAFKAKLGG
jgi:hypothetical protein